MLFIANEFNEIQTIRTIKVEELVFWTGLFLIGSSWENFTATTPSTSGTVDSGIPMNIVLRFFLGAAVMIACGAGIFCKEFGKIC